MLKRCTKCGEEKPLDQFYARRDGLHGRVAECKPCRYERNKKWIGANRERRYVTQKAWNAAHAGLRAKWYKENIAKAREQRRRIRAKRGQKYLIGRAKDAISKNTAIPRSQIPLAMAEAKAAQLAVMREIRG